MSTFRCAAGHPATLVFEDDQLRHPCPTCGIDVYRFRDAVPDEDGPAATVVTALAAPGRAILPLGVRHVRLAAGTAVVLAMGTAFVLARPDAAPPVSPGPVVPTAGPASKAAPDPAAVSIARLTAVATGLGTVQLHFRLTNRNGANDYPGLAVRWHGLPDGERLIARDAYPHPPLPFTTADVTLELPRPRGATGIDIRIAY
jgi:hypothetical protein